MKQKPLLTWGKIDPNRSDHPLPEKITEYPLSGFITGDPEAKCQTNSTQFVLCLLYLCFSHVGSSFASTYAQEQLPDKLRYSPLSDVILANVWYIPWAYLVTEGVIVTLVVIWMVLLFFHKYRFIVFQRIIVLIGTMFYFRTLCVVSTAIPMPQGDYDCHRLMFKNKWERLSHVFTVYISFGMRLLSVKTCGDYMCSGHAIIIIILVLSINEYSPASMVYLHRLTWLIGTLGLSCIFLCHCSYTVDVIMAVLLSLWLFIHYHSLPNIPRDRSLIKYFHIFYFLESNFVETFPNKFEWPV